ncbi:gp63 [Bacillus phage W.Ph.]|uniref:Gp63 n=1 Tax=Bacillus phage W.Ph. TaxID=764595 RepID=G9B1G4_9CAUD|nr:gp63 [Bacillus phage W.Ph.]ADH03209.1 gp63 [Bacillus phage W.Ph.]
MVVKVEENIKGVLVNNTLMSEQGIRKIEFEFNKDGSILSTYVERFPSACSWTDKMKLDAWKLI